MSAPERIWAKANYGRNNAGYWRDEPIIPNKPENSGTEYVRADLCTTDERVKALVEAATPYISPVQNADYARQLRQHDALVAALRDMEGGD